MAEKDEHPVGKHVEGGEKLVKRAADEDADEKPKPKKKPGRRNKSTTTTGAPSTTGSPASTSKSPTSGSSTTGKPASSTTGKPADSKSTTPKAADGSTTTTGKPKDDLDTDAVMKALKELGEEKVLLDKVFSDLVVWEAWIDSKQKSYTPNRWAKIYNKVGALTKKLEDFKSKEEDKRTTLKPMTKIGTLERLVNKHPIRHHNKYMDWV